MKVVIQSVIASAVVAFFAQQAGASPIDGQIIDGHLHIMARQGPTVESDVHRRHHRKRGSCETRAYSSSNKNTTSSGNTGSNLAQSKVSTSSSNNSGSSSNKSGSSSGSSSSSSNASSGSSSSSSSSSSGSSSSSNGSTSSSGSKVTAFAGTNSNAILSWFRTDSSSDSTNGQSWCQTKYQDDWICFAPSVGTMLAEFGGNYNAAAQAFCGLEAIVTDPSNGKSITAFICDGFDDKWVKTPASLDLTVGAFTQIYGSFDNNKNTVVQGATWKLTGNVVSKGTFKSSG